MAELPPERRIAPSQLAQLVVGNAGKEIAMRPGQVALQGSQRRRAAQRAVRDQEMDRRDELIGLFVVPARNRGGFLLELPGD